MTKRPAPSFRESSYSSSCSSSSYDSCDSEPVTRTTSPQPTYALPASCADAASNAPVAGASSDASTCTTLKTTNTTTNTATGCSEPVTSDFVAAFAQVLSPQGPQKRVKTLHPLQDPTSILVADAGFDYASAAAATAGQYPFTLNAAGTATASLLPTTTGLSATYASLQNDAFFGIDNIWDLDFTQTYSIFSPIPNAYFPDISSVMSRSGATSSPISQTSTLTTQIQAATPQPTQQEFFQNIPQAGPISIDTGRREQLAPDAAMPSRPIAMAVSPGRRDERNPLSGSLLGGMSWGGISVGSFIRDDIMMGTSPFTFQSPSFQSSSYLPKMEANFMKDYACCGIKLDSLHELLEHYEEEHAAVPNQTMGRTPTGQQAYAKIDTHHNHSHILPNPAQLQQQHQPPRTSNVILPPINHAFPSHPAVPGDLDDLDSMDMDDGPAPAVQPVNTDRQFQPQPQFGRQSSQSAMSSPINAFQNPRTTPPIDSQYNPTVSSVNAPNMDPMSRPGDLELNGMSTPRMPQTEGEFDMASLEGTPNQVSQATIDDPAKRLFAKQGFGGMRSPGFISQMGTPSVNGSQMGQPDETKPFRCPVIGCEKAYKNQNGLKYHKQHGHTSQKLKENPDGTFSIVDPTTSIPYPGTTGMEKEKPYRCETCYKRYKNLNGLKYHRSHTTMCNPDLQIGIDAGALNGLGGIDPPMAVAQGVNVAGAGLVPETALGF